MVSAVILLPTLQMVKLSFRETNGMPKIIQLITELGF